VSKLEIYFDNGLRVVLSFLRVIILTTATLATTQTSFAGGYSIDVYNDRPILTYEKDRGEIARLINDATKKGISVRLQESSKTALRTSFKTIAKFESGDESLWILGTPQSLTYAFHWVKFGNKSHWNWFSKSPGKKAADLGAIAPVNLTSPRLADILNRRDSSRVKMRYSLTRISGNLPEVFDDQSPREDRVVAILLGAISTVPVLPIDTKALHHDLWRWNKTGEYVKKANGSWTNLEFIVYSAERRGTVLIRL
jgi:hypothetical protein